MPYLLTQEDDPPSMPQGAMGEVSALSSCLSFLLGWASPHPDDFEGTLYCGVLRLLSP